MERIENRHNSDTQTAIFEETSDTLSIADMLKRTLERTITSGEDMTRSLGHTARSQKLPPEKLIKFSDYRRGRLTGEGVAPRRD